VPPTVCPRQGDALHITDLVLRDRIADLWDAESITPEAAADLTDAATRAAALARACIDAVIDAEAEAPEEYAELLVRVLNQVALRC
jgi:hypothetical protein